MTSEEARKELNNYKELLRKKKSLNFKITELEADLTSISAKNYENTAVQGGSINKSEEILLQKLNKIFEYKCKLAELILEANEYADKIVAKIDKIPSSTTRLVLTGLYIQGFSLRKLAFKEHYSYDYLKNVSSRAILDYIFYNNN